MNRKTLLLSLLAVCLLALPNTVLAQASRLYFAGYMGLNTNDDSAFEQTTIPRSGSFQYDNALSYAGALGLRLTKQFRAEAEISYRKTDFDRVHFAGAGNFNMGGDLGTWLYMVNGYYDFDLEWEHIQPYVSAGIGVAYHTGEIDDTSGLGIDAADSSIGFAWQVGGGLKYRMNDDLAFTGGYRWLSTTDAQFDNYDFEYGGHEIRFGLEYDIPVDLFK